jgi:hypothetical protein
MKTIAIDLVRSRPVSMRLHATSFKEHGVHRHGTAVSWWIASIVRLMESGIILVDKPSLPIWTEPQKSNRMRYDNFFSIKSIYLLEIIFMQALIRFPLSLDLG